MGYVEDRAIPAVDSEASCKDKVRRGRRPATQRNGLAPFFEEDGSQPIYSNERLVELKGIEPSAS